MLLPSLRAWVGVEANQGALGLCKGVRVTRVLIRIKDEVEFFTRLGLNGTFHEWLLSGSSENTESCDLSSIAYDMRICFPPGNKLILRSA